MGLNKSLTTSLGKQKEMVKLDFNNVFYLTLYVRNVIIQTCSQ